MIRKAGYVLLAAYWTANVAVIAVSVRVIYEILTKEGRYFD